jgi:small subunit ribosomal protein S21
MRRNCLTRERDLISFRVSPLFGPGAEIGQQFRSGGRTAWVSKEAFVVKLRLRERETVQEAVRRFRKLVEHAGIKKEMRRREFYEKPSDKRRRARRRAERRARMARLPAVV